MLVIYLKCVHGFEFEWLTQLWLWWNIYSICLFAQVGKFSNAVDSLGSKTLASIARAGPNTKVRICKKKKKGGVNTQLLSTSVLYTWQCVTWLHYAKRCSIEWMPGNEARAFKDCGYVFNVMLYFSWYSIQGRLLQSLGLENILSTDGNSPINLFRGVNNNSLALWKCL